MEPKLLTEYKYCMQKLNFISSIKPNDKIDFERNYLFKNDIQNSVIRTLTNYLKIYANNYLSTNEIIQSRNEIIKNINNIFSRTENILIELFEDKEKYQKYIDKLIERFEEACNGYKNLTITYQDDNNIISTINTEITLIKLKIEKYKEK